MIPDLNPIQECWQQNHFEKFRATNYLWVLLSTNLTYQQNILSFGKILKWEIERNGCFN